MAKYCDSAQLERVWFEWLVASAVPALEPYRLERVLWTRIIGTIQPNPRVTKFDPCYPSREHLVMLDRPVFLRSEAGEITDCRFDSKSGRRCGLPLHSGFVAQRQEFGMPMPDTAPLIDGFFRERPTDESWKLLLEEINKICCGIASRFHQPTEEARIDLAHEALLQVVQKLQRGRLVYCPGKAPVFNLLTTTIHRCIYSVLSKRGRQQANLNSLVQSVRSGERASRSRAYCTY